VLLQIVAPHTAGDPMSTRKWLNCRLSDIRQQLDERGHGVSKPVISRLLQAHGYSLRANRKHAAGKQHPERDTQFAQIQAQRSAHQTAGHPVISVDTKKKELVGNFKNAGQIWCQAAEVVDAHDFPQDALGRAVPYGIYDLQSNRGTVYGGQSADTPTFAVDTIAHWCATEMQARFPHATHLLIEADRGGSNSARSRVWKARLQTQVADRFGLTVTVCHYPTGASKWNPIEHRLFSEISKTWAGCPLRSFELVVQYIGETRTATGLSVEAQLVPTAYATGVKIPDEVMATLSIQAHEVCPQWNYTIYPRVAPAPSAYDAELILL
jgi:Rhodopirellula transposase DDE domain